MQAPYSKTLGRNPRDRLLPLFLFPSAVYGSGGTPKYIAPMSHPLASDGSESHSSLQSVNGTVHKSGTIVVSVQFKDVDVCGWRLEDRNGGVRGDQKPVWEQPRPWTPRRKGIGTAGSMQLPPRGNGDTIGGGIMPYTLLCVVDASVLAAGANGSMWPFPKFERLNFIT